MSLLGRANPPIQAVRQTHLHAYLLCLACPLDLFSDNEKKVVVDVEMSNLSVPPDAVHYHSGLPLVLPCHHFPNTLLTRDRGNGFIGHISNGG